MQYNTNAICNQLKLAKGKINLICYIFLSLDRFPSSALYRRGLNPVQRMTPEAHIVSVGVEVDSVAPNRHGSQATG